MKYKVGNKVRVRSDLIPYEEYGAWEFYESMEKQKGKVVTISEVGDDCYGIKEDGEDGCWTDEMFEPIEEMSAVEAIQIQGEICNSTTACKLCPINKIRRDTHLECAEFRAKNPEKVIEVLEHWKADHEKKPIETEFAEIICVIEDTGSAKRCVYEEKAKSDECWAEAQIRILKEYCKNHDGKFFTTVERICRVKE